MTISDAEMTIIGLNQDNSDVMYEVTSDFASNTKDAEAMSVFLQDEFLNTANKYKTRKAIFRNNYADWRNDALDDPNLIGLIPPNTVTPGTTLYTAYLNDINDAKL